MTGLTLGRVSAALNDAFDDLAGHLPADDDIYLAVSASWTNPAGKLVSMHISLTDADTDADLDDPDADVDIQRPRQLTPVDADDLDPDYIR